ncbi:hypothetical protein B0H16DRAFT_1446844 [Mycena metata]|uniref:Uncharacterized protein n=1 Tax=Mycena metata TaxID=1033252 RepID=A0AAD7KFW7_9AGAR|nr:hypothetical protein B0H16DRAFT_1446844 [Mycena metata]
MYLERMEIRLAEVGLRLTWVGGETDRWGAESGGSSRTKFKSGRSTDNSQQQLEDKESLSQWERVEDRRGKWTTLERGLVLEWIHGHGHKDSLARARSCRAVDGRSPSLKYACCLLRQSARHRPTIGLRSSSTEVLNIRVEEKAKARAWTVLGIQSKLKRACMRRSKESKDNTRKRCLAPDLIHSPGADVGRQDRTWRSANADKDYWNWNPT